MSGEKIMKSWNFEILDYWKNASRFFHQSTNPSIHQSIL